MNEWLDDFKTAVAFLTRLPMPHPQGAAPANFVRAHRMFPVVGGLIGAAVGLICLGLRYLGVPDLAAAALALRRERRGFEISRWQVQTRRPQIVKRRKERRLALYAVDGRWAHGHGRTLRGRRDTLQPADDAKHAPVGSDPIQGPAFLISAPERCSCCERGMSC